MKSTSLLLFALSLCFLGVAQGAIGSSDQPLNAEQTTASTETIEAAQGLIGRVLPAHAWEFTCELIPPDDGRDVFEIEANHGKIVLRGNDGVSLAVAFNWYLRYYAHANFDWQAAGPLKIDGRLPMPPAKVRHTCAARERFFFNYCTYGYSLPWWNWDQWQRLVDWMAINGINRPLLQCGQEAVWLRVWTSYGMKPEEVLAYFSAPAHLPWHRMANLDKWGGPLPMSYVDGQRKLQQQILARARQLGIKPILSAFAGHVPEALKTLKPEAHITHIKPGWGGMDAAYATWFLDPRDPLFQDVQVRFLNAQRELYGSDHLYGTDPFNEISPPSWNPDYLAGVARSIYDGMAQSDPQSVWYQMSWTFFADKKWTQPRLSAMIGAVPQGRMVLLDYVCEETPLYPQTEGFFGAPFIWCYLANFGGNTHLVAPLHKLSIRMAEALPVANCAGVGSTLEGLNVNPIAYDLLFEQPWHADAKPDLTQWVDAYAVRRAGRPDSANLKAWRMLADKVLLDNAQGIRGHGIMLEAIPKIKPFTRWANPEIPYQQADLVAALAEMFKADPACARSDGYQFDVVNLTRQVLGNQSATEHARMMRAYEEKDLTAFRAAAERFLEIGRDLDTLLGTRHEFLLGRWLADARGWAANPAEALYYQRNAREIITTWHKPGGGLSDYAHRQWSGLLRTYYLPRWQEFIVRLDKSLADDQSLDAESYDRWRVEFERQWIESTGPTFCVEPEGDPATIARRLYEKHGLAGS